MGNKVSMKPVIPSVKAQDEEDLVDPQQTLREECHKLTKCTELQEKYTACNDRVNSRKKTSEICSEELFDYLHCVDACVSKTLFSHLK
ncbi:cytochrome b-c1 complex subunit 6, mitochondrial [Zootermopsis nevadensis]|uniref:Cytochrome b-c1 complex subunit 6 n=1 Tax=Zootermopsis nevadensis TaxID=136037 RepID=A0A067RRN8_ZOONE|nr:cytochrome b-c1 complex subunit 6, mitochondrial [Zootermopsis nevadensis]KDR22439.1 Cytochrome b-c1 complex subunit 6, mitochondrial [Zootermopsis nevadensis]